MKDIFQYIDDHWHEALDDLILLCRQPSVSAQGLGMKETVDLLTRMMRQYDIEASVLPEPGSDYPVVYAEMEGRSPETLLFYNHYDVQPPEPLDLWTTPPFEPVIHQDMLRARGVSDNKGNIVARLLAVKAWLAVEGKLPVSVKFLIEGEEEIGSVNLPGFVEQNKELLKADACIWECGEVNWRGQPTIKLGLKGILCLELEARGAERDVHSSMATFVPNPAWRLVWALASLKDREENILIDGFYEHVRPLTHRDMEVLQAMPVDEEQTLRSLGLKQSLKGLHRMDYKMRHIFGATCNICGIYSGYTGPGMKTVLPCVARAKLDFRLVPDQRPDDIAAKLRRHLDSHGFNDIVILPEMEGENPARTPLDSPFVSVVADAAREVYGQEPVIIPNMVGSGPMYSFTDTLGLPVVCVGVEYPDSRAHAPDENIRIVDFINGAKHIAAIMQRMGQ